MTVKAWIAKLEDFLRLGDRDVLTHAGRISARVAQDKADAEYDRFRLQLDALPSPAERDMTRALEKALRQLSKPKGKKK